LASCSSFLGLLGNVLCFLGKIILLALWFGSFFINSLHKTLQSTWLINNLGFIYINNMFSVWFNSRIWFWTETHFDKIMVFECWSKCMNATYWSLHDSFDFDFEPKPILIRLGSYWF
jgi:hypothetical protein